MKIAHKEEIDDYMRRPVRCANPTCSGHLSYSQWKRGYRFCSSMCSRDTVAAAKVGRPNPAGRIPRSRSTKHESP